MIKRTKVVKRRKKNRRGLPTAEQKRAVRAEVFERSHGICELNLRDDCLGRVPWDGPDIWSRGHMAHTKSVGSGGKTDAENCKWACFNCHILGGHQGVTRDSKPVPSKTWHDRIDA